MVSVPLGDGTIEVTLPTCEVDVAEPSGGTVVEPRPAADRALADPHGPPLRTIADEEGTVAIVVTDVTRKTPDEALLQATFTELRAAGIDRSQVTIVVGLGLHRPMTDEELTNALGEYADLAINHDPERTVTVGQVDGTPVEVHEVVAEADTVVSIGVVEPHQYAGFSGGAKTVVIGAGGEALIRHTHGPELLSDPGVRLGRIEDNPFRDLLDRAGEAVGLGYCLNVTRGSGGVLAVRAGEPRRVVQDLAARARAAHSVPVDDGYDAVVAGVGAPKDANLYQTTRAATYVILGARNPLAQGGRVVIPAELSEGAGSGAGEQRFHERLSASDSPAALYQTMREGYAPGAQRAFVVARALRDHGLYITNSRAPAVVEDCLMEARETVADAIDPGSRVLVIPDALNTLLVGDREA